MNTRTSSCKAWDKQDVKALMTMNGWGYSTKDIEEKLKGEGYLDGRSSQSVAAKLVEIRNYVGKRQYMLSDTQNSFFKMAQRIAKPHGIMQFAPETLKTETAMKHIDSAIVNNEFANVQTLEPEVELKEQAPVQIAHIAAEPDNDEKIAKDMNDIFFGRENAPMPSSKMMMKYIKIGRKTGASAIEVVPGAIIFHIQ